MSITVPDEMFLSEGNLAERIPEGGKVLAPSLAKLRDATHTAYAWSSRPTLFSLQGKAGRSPLHPAFATRVDGANPRETLGTGIGRLTRYGRRLDWWVLSANLDWALEVWTLSPPALLATITPPALSTPSHLDKGRLDLVALGLGLGSELDLQFIFKARRFATSFDWGSLDSVMVQEAPIDAAHLP